MALRSLLLLSASILLLLSASMQGCKREDTSGDDYRRVTFLHTSDQHGRFIPYGSHKEGGMAAQLTVVKKIREEVAKKKGEVLLVSSGDWNTGLPQSDILLAKPDILGMNMLGYNLTTLGNHEFDFKLDTLLLQKEWANFPFVTANVYYKGNGTRVFQPYKIITVHDDIRIAFIGLTTADTKELAVNVADDVEFLPVINETQKVIHELDALSEDKKPHLKVIVSHLGFYPNKEEKRGEAAGDIMLLESLEHGEIPMMLGGHSHRLVCANEAGSQEIKNVKNVYNPGDECIPFQHGESGTYVVHSQYKSNYISRVDLRLSKTGPPILKKYELLPINVWVKEGNYSLPKDRYKPDPDMLELFQPFLNQVNQTLSRDVCWINGTWLENDGKIEVIRHEQTNLGRFLNHAQMSLVERETNAPCDFSVSNSGSIRATLGPKSIGDRFNVTYGDVLSIFPLNFVQTTAAVTMNGTEVQKYLDIVALQKPGGGKFPQFYGIKMTINYKQDTVEDVQVLNKTSGLFEKLSPARDYTFALNTYIGEGYDTYPKVSDLSSYRVFERLTNESDRYSGLGRAFNVFQEHINTVMGAERFVDVDSFTDHYYGYVHRYTEGVLRDITYDPCPEGYHHNKYIRDIDSVKGYAESNAGNITACSKLCEADRDTCHAFEWSSCTDQTETNCNSYTCALFNQIKVRESGTIQKFGGVDLCLKNDIRDKVCFDRLGEGKCTSRYGDYSWNICHENGEPKSGMPYWCGKYCGFCL